LVDEVAAEQLEGLQQVGVSVAFAFTGQQAVGLAEGFEESFRWSVGTPACGKGQRRQLLGA
jgi:hypothetical protein